MLKDINILDKYYLNSKIKLKLIKGIISYIFENEENKFLIPFRFLCVIAWQIWKRTISLPIIVRLSNGLKYYADPFAANSTGAIYVSTYEKKYINFLRKNISLKTSKWIDVGSNTGLFAMWFADIFSKWYLFEPTPDLYSVLKINVQINLLEEYETFNLACSDKKQKLSLVLTGNLSGNNRILDDKNIVQNFKQYTKKDGLDLNISKKEDSSGINLTMFWKDIINAMRRRNIED